MTRSIRLALAAAIFAFSAGAADAHAQLSVAGGPSVALGNLGDFTDMGYHVQGSFGLSVPLIPIALRVDGAWNQFPGTGTADDLRILSGTANAVISIPSLGITPYLIGGLGAYNSQWDADDDADPLNEDATDIGANLGVGVRLGLPGLSAFAEARVHNLFNDGDSMRFIPISVGLRF